MATEVAERLMSAEEYLLWEREQPFKYELINNRTYPMPGSSPSHNLINFDLAFAIRSRLENQGCKVFGIDIQLQVDRASTYTYPDVIVVCGEAQFTRHVSQAMLENPTLIFEILSPSTESRDRNQKLDQYLEIPSLTGYYLVAQDKPLIEAHQRAGDGWHYEAFAGLDASLVIPAPVCEIPLSEVYRQVSFEND